MKSNLQKCIVLYRRDVSSRKRRTRNFSILWRTKNTIVNECDNLSPYIRNIDEANILHEILFFVVRVTGLLSKSIICTSIRPENGYFCGLYTICFAKFIYTLYFIFFMNFKLGKL